MNKKLLDLVEVLRQAGQRRYHLTVEDDPFYSCPKSPGGCTDDSQPKDVCNCGADKHNAQVDAAAAALAAEIGKFAPSDGPLCWCGHPMSRHLKSEDTGLFVCTDCLICTHGGPV